MAELFGGRSYTSQSFTGSEVFNMPRAISANSSQKKKLTGSPACELTPFPYIPPMRSTLSSCKTWFIYLFIFYILLQIQLLWGWERLLFCLWKINSHYKQDRKKDESKKKETGSYPCQSDPAWRLSSPLIALLISSPLRVDLGQQSSSAGADWRLFLHELSHAAFFPPWPLRPILVRIQHIRWGSEPNTLILVLRWPRAGLILFFLTWQIIISALYSILGVEIGLLELTFVFPSGDARCAFSYFSALCTFSQDWNVPGMPRYCSN